MKIVTIQDMIDEDPENFYDALVVRTLKQDVMRRLDNFINEPDTAQIVDAMLIVLQYYMPEEDYFDWYVTIQPKLGDL